MKPLFFNQAVDRKTIESLFDEKNILKYKFKYVYNGGVDSLLHLTKDEIIKYFGDLKTKIKHTSFYFCDKDKPSYVVPDIAIVNGNVPEHVDSNWGCVLIVLLKILPFYNSETDSECDSDEAIFWTNHGFRSIQIGDVFIFDSFEPHAWFCNGNAYLFSHPLNKISHG